MREGSGYTSYVYSAGPGPAGSGAGSGPRGGRAGRRPGVSVLTHLVVALLAAAAAVGVTLEVDHPAASSGASLPGAAAVPSPHASPPGGTAAGGSEQQVVNKVEPGLAVITTDVATGKTYPATVVGYD